MVNLGVKYDKAMIEKAELIDHALRKIDPKGDVYHVPT